VTLDHRTDKHTKKPRQQLDALGLSMAAVPIITYLLSLASPHPIYMGWFLNNFEALLLITLHYIFALSHSSLTLQRNNIASIVYRSGHIGVIITSDSYCSKLTDQCYCLYLLLLYVMMYLLSTSPIPYI
jgi:hypothetical protein